MTPGLRTEVLIRALQTEKSYLGVPLAAGAIEPVADRRGSLSENTAFGPHGSRALARCVSALERACGASGETFQARKRREA